MSNKARCLSISQKNEDADELVCEYADAKGATYAGATFAIIRDWNRLKMKEMRMDLVLQEIR